jgi:hypothetical protein
MYVLSKPKKFIWIKTTRVTWSGRQWLNSSSGVNDAGTTSFSLNSDASGYSVPNFGQT